MPGCHSTDDEQHTRYSLQGGGACVVLQLRLCLLKLDLSVSARHATKLGIGQRWVEYLWYQGKATERNDQEAHNTGYRAPKKHSRHRCSLPCRPASTLLAGAL